MTACWINAFPILDVGWKKAPPFYVLKIKIYVNFYPALYSSASKTVCISMTNPYWASTQTLKSKVGISIGNPPRWHLTPHLIDTQPYCLWFISWVECKGFLSFFFGGVAFYSAWATIVWYENSHFKHIFALESLFSSVNFPTYIIFQTYICVEYTSFFSFFFFNNPCQHLLTYWYQHVCLILSKDLLAAYQAIYLIISITVHTLLSCIFI